MDFVHGETNLGDHWRCYGILRCIITIANRHRPDDCSLPPVVEEELVNSQARSWLDRGGSWRAISAKHRCMERGRHGCTWGATGGSRPPGTRSGTPRDRCPRPDIASLGSADRDVTDHGLVEPIRWAEAPSFTDVGPWSRPGPPPWRAEGAAVLRDDGVVADEEEGAREDADDGDQEQGESTAGAFVGEINDGRGMRWEDDVAPLGAVEAAETQREVLALLLVNGGHGQQREEIRLRRSSLSQWKCCQWRMFMGFQCN